jgi:hypothetical protein
MISRRALTALLLLVVVACSGGDEPEAAAPETAGEVTAAADDGGETLVVDRGAPIATASTAGGTVLEITQLRRYGDVVLLAYTIDNSASEEDFETRFFWARESGFRGNWLDEPYLLDEDSRVRYRVIVDEDGECLCHDLMRGGVDAGETLSFNSVHPAPEGDVDALTVVFPNFPPFPSIPLSDS